VGLRSNTHAVLVTLKRAASELSSYQKKIFKVDDHMGVAIAGLTADGRILSRYMRNECINHRFVYDMPLPVSRMVREVADKSQVCTQRSYKRPYGVGLLVAGHDVTGPHLFQTCPSGNFYEYYAIAIGARSQAAKTYLERKFETFKDLPLLDLVLEGLQALSASIQDGELSAQNCSVAVVGKDMDFTILEDEALEPYIAGLREREGGGEAAAPADEAAPMET